MALKGMSMPIKLVVVIIVILISALLVLGVFSGGLQNIQLQFDSMFAWLRGQSLP